MLWPLHLEIDSPFLICTFYKQKNLITLNKETPMILRQRIFTFTLSVRLAPVDFPIADFLASTSLYSHIFPDHFDNLPFIFI